MVEVEQADEALFYEVSLFLRVMIVSILKLSSEIFCMSVVLQVLTFTPLH